MHKAVELLFRFWKDELAAVCILFVLGVLLEQTALRASATQTHRNRLFNLMLAFNFQLFNFFTSALLATWVTYLAQRVGGGWIRVPLHDGTTLIKAAALVGLWGIVYDFFYYWFHRLQHRSIILWQEHALHHSDECVNVTTTLRHHLLENPLRAIFIALPMAVLFKLPLIAVPVVWFFFRVLSDFKHLNLRLNLGPLTPVIVGPQLHRIHHSCLVEHTDRNFAAFFPIYDVLFGTYYRPRKNEYPPTGLQSGERDLSILRAYFKPFQVWYRMLKRGQRRPPMLPRGSKPEPQDPAPILSQN